MPALFHLDRSKSDAGGEPVEADIAQLRDASLAAAYYVPRSEGNFYDFLRVGTARALFALFECVDHSEEHQEITAAVAATFREAGPRVFAKEDINLAEAMIELCLELNRTILETGQPHSCPAFAGCYDESLSTVWYINAASAAALVRDPTGVTALPATGLPLGLFSHTTCDASPVALQPGAALLVVTRGVVEAKSQDGEFGLEGVKTTFAGIAAVNAGEICRSMLARLREFSGAPPQSSDVTALALARSTAAKVNS